MSKNVSVADSAIEKSRVSHLIKAYRHEEYKPCSVFGMGQRQRYPGFFVGSNCDAADDWERSKGKFSKRGKSTYQACTAYHQSVIYPTQKMVDTSFLKISKWKAKAQTMGRKQEQIRKPKAEQANYPPDKMVIEEDSRLPIALRNIPQLLQQPCLEDKATTEGEEDATKNNGKDDQESSRLIEGGNNQKPNNDSNAVKKKERQHVVVIESTLTEEKEEGNKKRRGREGNTKETTVGTVECSVEQDGSGNELTDCGCIPVLSCTMENNEEIAQLKQQIATLTWDLAEAEKKMQVMRSCLDNASNRLCANSATKR
ncbi:hypothetical protein ACA910_007277 [Epithemia clementina (nom. ined.)]